MELIGTHNSATGEKARGIFSKLLTPFAKTQTKSIQEQYDAGCRFFDLRVKLSTKDRDFVLCHGAWIAQTSFSSVLEYLNSKKNVLVMVTYEGELHNEEEILWFTTYITNLFQTYPHIQLTTINLKKPYWQCLKTIKEIWSIQGYKNLDGSTWHTYLPIPWLWDKLYSRPHKFNNEFYTFVDFL